MGTILFTHSLLLVAMRILAYIVFTDVAQHIPHIRETFPYPAEVINLIEPVAMTNEEGNQHGVKACIWRDDIGDELNNWHCEMIPDVLSLE